MFDLFCLFTAQLLNHCWEMFLIGRSFLPFFYLTTASTLSTLSTEFLALTRSRTSRPRSSRRRCWNFRTRSSSGSTSNVRTRHPWATQSPFSKKKMFSNFFQKNLFVVFFKLWRIIWKVRKLFDKFLGWRYQRSTFCDVILFNHFLRSLHEFRTAEIVENLQWRRSFYFFWSHKFFFREWKNVYWLHYVFCW